MWYFSTFSLSKELLIAVTIKQRGEGTHKPHCLLDCALQTLPHVLLDGLCCPSQTALCKLPLGAGLKRERPAALKEQQCFHSLCLSVPVHALWPSSLPALCFSWMPRDTTAKRVMAALFLLRSTLPAPKSYLVETSWYSASITTGAKTL